MAKRTVPRAPPLLSIGCPSENGCTRVEGGCRGTGVPEEAVGTAAGSGRTGVPVADHIAVSTTELREIGRSVAKLKCHFEHAKDLVDSYDAEMGSGEVAEALDAFADDWKKKRKQLCDGLEFLGRTAEEAAKAYDGLDQHLADALLKSQAGKGGEGK